MKYCIRQNWWRAVALYRRHGLLDDNTLTYAMLDAGEFLVSPNVDEAVSDSTAQLIHQITSEMQPTSTPGIRQTLQTK